MYSILTRTPICNAGESGLIPVNHIEHLPHEIPVASAAESLSESVTAIEGSKSEEENTEEEEEENTEEARKNTEEARQCQKEADGEEEEENEEEEGGGEKEEVRAEEGEVMVDQCMVTATADRQEGAWKKFGDHTHSDEDLESTSACSSFKSDDLHAALSMWDNSSTEKVGAKRHGGGGQGGEGEGEGEKPAVLAMTTHASRFRAPPPHSLPHPQGENVSVGGVEAAKSEAKSFLDELEDGMSD